MNRLVVLLVLAAPAVGSDWQKRQSEFYSKASAERKELGLDSKAVKAKYPTPEVTFSGSGSSTGGGVGRCLALCPRPGQRYPSASGCDTGRRAGPTTLQACGTPATQVASVTTS